MKCPRCGSGDTVLMMYGDDRGDIFEWVKRYCYACEYLWHTNIPHVPERIKDKPKT